MNVNKITEYETQKEQIYATNKYTHIITKDKRDLIINENKKELMEYLQNHRYLLIDKNKQVTIYESIRKMASDINVSPSSICKKLKSSNYCMCVPKKSTDVFYIQHLHE